MSLFIIEIVIKEKEKCLLGLCKLNVTCMEMYFNKAFHQTRTIPGIGIEVLVFWAVLVLVLKSRFSRYWYWYWYWKFDFSGIGIGIGIDLVNLQFWYFIHDSKFALESSKMCQILQIVLYWCFFLHFWWERSKIWTADGWSVMTSIGIGIEVLEIRPVLVLVLVLKIWLSRYWYWYWYWRSDSPGIGIGIEILHITGIGIGIGFENLVLSGSGRRLIFELIQWSMAPRPNVNLLSSCL